MAIYTPRGLKIRLSKAYAFALMSRVFPHVDAFRVLQLTEEVENIASTTTFIVGIVAFSMRLEPIVIGLVIALTCFSFKMVHLLGLFIPPFKLILPLSRVYSWFAGYGIFFVGLMVLGFFTVGWKGILSFIVARLAAGWLAGAIDFAYAIALSKKMGIPITASERSFFHAYRLSADQVSASPSLEVSDAEMEIENWQPVFTDLMMKWPVVVSRFTPD